MYTVSRGEGAGYGTDIIPLYVMFSRLSQTDHCDRWKSVY